MRLQIGGDPGGSISSREADAATHRRLPPNAIVSEMSATGFAGVEVQRQHVHRERDLADLLSAVRFRERNSQLLSLSDAAYEAGLRRIEGDLDDPQRHKVHSDHLCFVTVRGDRR
jgi:hypothetical protein